MASSIPRPKSAFAAGLVEYLIADYFDGDPKRFAAQVGYTEQQVKHWRQGTHKPQKATLRWMLSSTIAPELKVACEFAPVHILSKTKIAGALKAALDGHEMSAGVYAFYDSMCDVIYVGKASGSFGKEMYQQMRKPLGVSFPKAIKHAPTARWQATRFFSAYEVPAVAHLDYPKHVEALVLRLSKPVGNKILGTLGRSQPPKAS